MHANWFVSKIIYKSEKTSQILASSTLSRIVKPWRFIKQYLKLYDIYKEFQGDDYYDDEDNFGISDETDDGVIDLSDDDDTADTD